MAAYRRVCDSRHLQADCQEPDQLQNPTLGNRVWATFTFFTFDLKRYIFRYFSNNKEIKSHKLARFFGHSNSWRFFGDYLTVIINIDRFWSYLKMCHAVRFMRHNIKRRISCSLDAKKLSPQR